MKIKKIIVVMIFCLCTPIEAMQIVGQKEQKTLVDKLMIATNFGNLKQIKLLLEEGANPFDTSSEGFTPYDEVLCHITCLQKQKMYPKQEILKLFYERFPELFQENRVVIDDSDLDSSFDSGYYPEADSESSSDSASDF